MLLRFLLYQKHTKNVTCWAGRAGPPSFVSLSHSSHPAIGETSMEVAGKHLHFSGESAIFLWFLYARFAGHTVNTGSFLKYADGLAM